MRQGGIEAAGTHRKRPAFLRAQESFTMKRNDIIETMGSGGKHLALKSRHATYWPLHFI